MVKMAQLKFNDPAPDTELLNMDGVSVKISSLWQGGVLVLAFTRHFGCPQCKEMLDQLVQFKPDFAARGLGLAVVTHATPGMARTFCSERAPGVQCFADPDRKAYQAYGLGRASLLQSVLSLRVMRSNKR